MGMISMAMEPYITDLRKSKYKYLVAQRFLSIFPHEYEEEMRQQFQ